VRLAGDVMLEVGVKWLGGLLGLEGGCVAIRGCDAGGRCHMAKTVVGAGGRMCGY
jgi:hypothetical protein